jgi:hypothetical protein
MTRQDDDTPLPAPTRYVRMLGPFLVDGQNFGVKLNVVCYKQSKHGGMCTEDDIETVSSLKIVDDKGKSHFKQSFPISLVHKLGRHLVDARLLEGREHQALEIIYEDLPTPPRTGESVQIFGLENGTLRPFDPEPLEYQGGLADLPAGRSKDSRRLLANDTFEIYELTTYFYIVTPVRIDWKNFRLEQQDSGEFAVANAKGYQVRPDIESNRAVQMYTSPEPNAKSAAVSLTPQSRVELLKARFSDGPPDEHDSANDTWLEIRVDGREGWILGVDDYTALGLTFLNQGGTA